MAELDIIAPMKTYISHNNVLHLISSLDDFYRMDLNYDDEHKIWGDYDLLNIIKDLQRADMLREDDLIEVTDETFMWLSCMFDTLMDTVYKGTEPRKLSKVTQQALMEHPEIPLHPRFFDDDEE